MPKHIVFIVLLVASTASIASAQTPPQGAVAVRESDSLLNGALIGTGAAVASGLLLCTMMEPWENCRDDYGPMARIGAIGAAPEAA